MRDDQGSRPSALAVLHNAQDRLALLARLRSDTPCSIDVFHLDVVEGLLSRVPKRLCAQARLSEAESCEVGCGRCWGAHARRSRGGGLRPHGWGPCQAHEAVLRSRGGPRIMPPITGRRPDARVRRAPPIKAYLFPDEMQPAGSMTMSCIWVVFEKQIVWRTRRLIRVRNVRCLRSIFWVFRLPGLCTSGSRCRVDAPQ